MIQFWLNKASKLGLEIALRELRYKLTEERTNLSVLGGYYVEYDRADEILNNVKSMKDFVRAIVRIDAILADLP